MEHTDLPRGSGESKRRSDARSVASCLILLAIAGPAMAALPFSTFLMDNASMLSVGHDAAGNLYTFGIRSDGTGFVSRLDANASRIDYTRALTGLGCDQYVAMAVDPAGNMYIAGTTAGSLREAYPCLLKLSAAGEPIYSYVFERAVPARPAAIAAGADGTVIVTGYAYGPGFPSVGGGFFAPESSVTSPEVIQPFIARIDAAGTRLLATAVGVGGGHIAIGPGGDIYVSGNAAAWNAGDPPSHTYPVTPAAFQTTSSRFLTFSTAQQYVTRVHASLTRLIYSTFVAGNGGTLNRALAVDSEGHAYVTGLTYAADYPFTTGEPAPASPSAFLTKLDPAGAKLIWSVQHGGDLLALDAGSLVVSGSVYPKGGLPYMPASLPPSPPAGDVPAACLPTGLRVQIAAFVQRVNARDGSAIATQLLSATRAEPSAVDLLPDGRVLTAGASIFPDIPITPGTVYSRAVAERTLRGAFLAAFDLATASIGGALACAADALTNMPLGPVAPGQVIALFGNKLGPASPVAASISGPNPVPTSLGGVTVTFDGVAAPLTYVSSTQINLGVPWEVRGRTSTLMTSTFDGRTVASREFVVAASSPSLFVDTSGVPADGNSFFPAIALNEDGSMNSQDHPARGGSWVTLFLNGAAAYSGADVPATGSIAGPDAAPTGVVVRAGNTLMETGPLIPWPGVLSGLYQVRVRMPSAGQDFLRAAPVTVTLDGTPAGPLVYFDKVYQAGGLVWVE